MIRLLLVDDEPMLLVGVRKLLEGTDYMVAGTASNGIGALAFLEHNPVDIVMTDLKMPGMNGIELIHHLRSEHFEGEVLALSNYSDFELVRDALTEGARDYVLKSDMTRDNLLNRLDKLSGIIRARQMERAQETQKALEQEKNAQKLIAAEIERSILFADAAISPATKALISGDGTRPVQHGVLLIDASTPADQKRRPFARQLRNILPEIFSDLSFPQTMQIRQDQLLCLLFDIRDREQLQAKARQTLRQSQVYFKAEPAIAMSLCAGDIGAVRDGYNACKTALRYAFYFPETRLFPTDKFPRFLPPNASFYHEFLRQTAAAFRSGSADAAISEMRGFLSISAQRLYDPDWVKTCCCRCSENLLLSAGVHTDGTISALTRQLEEAPDIHTLLRWMFDGLTAALAAEHGPAGSHKQEVLSALAFIDGHYSEKLSLEDIADHVQLNKSYLCRLFKQKTGMSVFSYINQVRMQKAAQLLTQKGAGSVTEIAAAVGIEDSFYFTRKFKEFFGRSPREYAKEMADAR